MNERDHSVMGFLSHFKLGIAKPSRYRVEFNLPKGVNLAPGQIGVNEESTANNIRRMQNYFNSQGGIDIKCLNATFPQRSLLTSEHRQNSAPFRVPFSSTYDPVTFSFYADSTFDTREYFEIWQGAVVNFGTNTMNFYDEFVSDVRMFQLNDLGEDSYSVELFEAYPINVGIVDSSYAQANAFQTITVTMSFRSWKPANNSLKFQKSASA